MTLIKFFACSIVLPVFLLGSVSFAHAKYNVAYRSIANWISTADLRLDISVWYPTKRSESLLVYGEWQFYGAKNTQPLKIVDEIKTKELEKNNPENSSKIYKKFPLIILSHDSTGTRFSYHTLAHNLASQGYIVAAPTHVGDNMYDMSLTFTGHGFRYRALKISSTLDLLLDNVYLTPFVDTEKITFLGLGGASAVGFLLAGAELTAENWESYCIEENISIEKHTVVSEVISSNANNVLVEGIAINPHALNTPEEQIQLILDETNKKNPYCFGVLHENLSKMVDSIYEDAERERRTILHYTNALKDKERKYKIAHSRVQTLVAQQKRTTYKGRLLVKDPPFLMPFFPPLPTQRPSYDERFNHFIFISPGYAALFSAESLANVQKKVLLVGLGQETVNLPEIQSLVFKERLDNKMVSYAMIEDANIWALQAECPSQNALAELCDAVSDDSREDILEDITVLLLDFLPQIE